MKQTSRASIIIASQAVFAAATTIFFCAGIACTDLRDIGAMLGPVPIRAIGMGGGLLAAIASVLSLLVGGWRALAVDIALFVAIGLTLCGLNIGAITWQIIGRSEPLPWGVVTGGAAIAVVLIDYGLFWGIRKLSPTRRHSA